MRGKEKNVPEIREILRCYRITGSKKETARTLKIAKGTVKRYVRWAEAKGYLEAAEFPTEADLAAEWRADDRGRAATPSPLEVHREAIHGWLDERIVLTRIQEMLAERHGWSGSYESLKRFTRPMREVSGACVRIEVAPGAEAQVDFGYAGLLWDPAEGRHRRAWLFLMTLSHSRHAYGEFVFSQDTDTWLACHRRAFEFFGGVPRKIVLDNLKAAIIKAALYDPLVNRSYREFAEHYGFLISPCLPGMPQHKGKVERGVPYVRKSFMAGRAFRDVADANAQLIDWLLTKAGLRVHGTTKRKPLEVFEALERSALLGLPEKPFGIVAWKDAILHRDCHVIVDGSYYSAPHRLRGETLLVRIGDGMVRVFHDHQLVATHIRATRPGTRRTITGHYPPEKAAWLEQSPQWCLAQARGIGPATHRFIREIFSRQHPLDGLRCAQGILAFAKRYSAPRLEAAAARALTFGAFTYQAVKRILEQGLDRHPQPPLQEEQPPLPRAYLYARPIDDFVAKATDKELPLWN